MAALSKFTRLLGLTGSKDISARFSKRLVIHNEIDKQNADPDFTSIDHLTREDWAALDKELTELLEQRNDRALAITFLAALEDRLQWAIERAFIPDLSETDKTEIFSGTNPLATFSGKVRIAYAQGLVTKGARAEFLLLANIRNKFAHNFRPVRFTDPKIVTLCQNLSLDGETNTPETDYMMRYARCCFLGMTALLATGQINAHVKRKAQESALHGKAEE